MKIRKPSAIKPGHDAPSGAGRLGLLVCSREGRSPRNPVSFSVRLFFFPQSLKTKSMKTKLTLKFAAAVLLCATFGLPLSTAFAQGMAFTYQDQIQNNGNPATACGGKE